VPDTGARELGLGLRSSLGPEEAAAVGHAAEAAGFDVVSVYHDLPWPPAIAPLLRLAAATERMRLGPAALNPFALHPVPLTIGTWGPRTAAWAETLADEVKIGGTANPDLIPRVREWLGNKTTRIVAGCVSVVDEDGAWARERAAAAAAPYLEVVAALDPTLERRPAREPPLDRFAIAGSPEEVAAHVERLWDAGADRVELGTPQGRTVLDGVELLGRRVVPLLRS